MMRRILRIEAQWVAAVLLLFVLPALCQTAQPSSADIAARVDSLLKQLSLKEKVDLIGGVDAFYIRDIPHIHFPRRKMSDGPIGVRNHGETRQITVKLDRRAFAYYDVKKHDWKVEPGDFDVYVARSAAQIELTGKFAVKTPSRCR
jgi:Fibronectin type III-like domain